MKKYSTNLTDSQWNIINNRGRFLAPDPVVTDPSSLLDFNRYMYARNNPVRAGIVENPEEYLYSSARAFAGKDCVLDVVNMILPMDKLPLMRTLK